MSLYWLKNDKKDWSLYVTGGYLLQVGMVVLFSHNREQTLPKSTSEILSHKGGRCNSSTYLLRKRNVSTQYVCRLTALIIAETCVTWHHYSEGRRRLCDRKRELSSITAQQLTKRHREKLCSWSYIIQATAFLSWGGIIATFLPFLLVCLIYVIMLTNYGFVH